MSCATQSLITAALVAASIGMANAEDYYKMLIDQSAMAIVYGVKCSESMYLKEMTERNVMVINFFTKMVDHLPTKEEIKAKIDDLNAKADQMGKTKFCDDVEALYNQGK